MGKLSYELRSDYGARGERLRGGSVGCPGIGVAQARVAGSVIGGGWLVVVVAARIAVHRAGTAVDWTNHRLTLRLPGVRDGAQYCLVQCGMIMVVVLIYSENEIRKQCR